MEHFYFCRNETEHALIDPILSIFAIIFLRIDLTKNDFHNVAHDTLVVLLRAFPGSEQIEVVPSAFIRFSLFDTCIRDAS